MDKKTKKKLIENKMLSLCEAVADIAYEAGYRRFYSGNSRQDMSDFVMWAQEFETIWKNKEWGADDTQDDYLDEITKFSNRKMNESISSKIKNG